jgi:hypothetical protein
MTQKKKSTRFRSSVNPAAGGLVTFGKLALATLVVLATASLASGVPKDDKDEDGNYYPAELTQVYQHTYDEVFQACQDTIERRGLFVTATDKDKGTISGSGKGSEAVYRGGSKNTLFFSMHIELLNSKPETQVTIRAHWARKWPHLVVGGSMSSERNHAWEEEMAVAVQKVLSTYR